MMQKTKLPIIVLAAISGPLLVSMLPAAEAKPKKVTPVEVQYRSFENESLKRFAWVGRRVAFLTAKLWKEAAKRPRARSTQDAIDNFILAASAAAGKDLSKVFTETWRWPMSEAAKAEAKKLPASPKTQP